MNADTVKNEKDMEIKDIEKFDIKTIFNIKTYDATLSLTIKPYKNFPSNIISYGEIVEIPRSEGTECQVEAVMTINSTAKSPQELCEILNLHKTYLTGLLQNIEKQMERLKHKMEEDDGIN
jgi:hypothetical protein